MNKRVEAIDFCRGISVLIMIVVHTLWMYGDKYTQTESGLGTLVHILGKGTASFLVAMGFCLALSRNQNVLTGIKRGVLLLGMGYLMNGLKFLVPIFVFGTMPQSFIGAYGWQSPLDIGQALYLLQTGDILQMAGIAMILIAMIRRVVTNRNHIFLLALAVAFSARLISGYRPDIVGLNYLADLLWGDQYNVYFPVLPWMSCILFGLYFGQLYQDKSLTTKALFRQILGFGIVLLSIGVLLCWQDFKYHFNDFFHLGAGGVLYLTGLNLIALWLASLLIDRFSFHRVKPLLNYCSQRVTTLYVIQWTLVCWGMGIVGFAQLNTWQTLAAMPVMLLLTLGVQKGLDKVLVKKPAEAAENFAANHS